MLDSCCPLASSLYQPFLYSSLQPTVLSIAQRSKTNRLQQTTQKPDTVQVQWWNGAMCEGRPPLRCGPPKAAHPASASSRCSRQAGNLPWHTAPAWQPTSLQVIGREAGRGHQASPSACGLLAGCAWDRAAVAAHTGFDTSTWARCGWEQNGAPDWSCSCRPLNSSGASTSRCLRAVVLGQARQAARKPARRC